MRQDIGKASKRVFVILVVGLKQLSASLDLFPTH